MGSSVISISGGNLLIDDVELATEDYVDTEIDEIGETGAIGPVKEFTVDHAGAAGYRIDEVVNANLRLQPNTTYKFDLSDSSLYTNSHDFEIQDSAGAEYLTGVSQVGTQGVAGAYMLWTVDNSVPGRMGYGCGAHAAEGGNVEIHAITGNLVPTADNTFDIGSATNKVKDLYLSESSLHLGSSVISISGGNLLIDDVELATEDYVDTEIDEIGETGAIGPVKEFTVDHAGAAGYRIDEVVNANLRLQPNTTYKFDLSDSSLYTNSHDFEIQDSAGAEYLTGVSQVGTQGVAGAYMLWTVDNSVPGRMGYGCGAHAAEGGNVEIHAITGNLVPTADNTFDIGSAANKVKDLYLSESSLHMGDSVISISGGSLLIDDVELATEDYVDSEIDAFDDTIWPVREFIVTYDGVAGSGGDFKIDGNPGQDLRIYRNITYRFNLASGTLASHDFRIEDDSGVEYTPGVVQVGVQGQANCYML